MPKEEKGRKKEKALNENLPDYIKEERCFFLKIGNDYLASVVLSKKSTHKEEKNSSKYLFTE